MAGGAAQSITIADLSNVIHFVIDAASKASAESQMKKMQQEASKTIRFPSSRRWIPMPPIRLS